MNPYPISNSFTKVSHVKNLIDKFNQISIKSTCFTNNFSKIQNTSLETKPIQARIKPISTQRVNLLKQNFSCANQIIPKKEEFQVNTNGFKQEAANKIEKNKEERKQLHPIVKKYLSRTRVLMTKCSSIRIEDFHNSSKEIEQNKNTKIAKFRTELESVPKLDQQLRYYQADAIQISKSELQKELSSINVELSKLEKKLEEI